MRGQWSITVARIEISSNDPASLVIGGVGDVGPPISSARITTALRRVPRRAVNCRREQTLGESGRWR